MNKENADNSKELLERNPTHMYVLWATSEIIGYSMKEACEKLGIGKTKFKTNVRNRYICRVKL